MITAGIDVGVTGALGALDDAGEFLAVHDLPIVRDGRLGWVDAPELLRILAAVRGDRPMRVFVERTHAMPQNGSQASFSQGLTLGSTLATLQAAGLPIVLVTPAEWKRWARLSSDKRAALDKARLRWPTAPLDRKKDIDRAEALHIAEFGRCSGLETISVRLPEIRTEAADAADVGGGAPLTPRHCQRGVVNRRLAPFRDEQE